MALQTITNKQKSILRKLQQKKHRRLLGLCTEEGEKGGFEAFEAGVVEVVIIDSKYKGKIPKQVEVYVATPGELKDLQQTETFPGIMAVCAIPEVKSIGNGHVIILDRMSDPGNMGTIIRTADWFGIRDIVLSQECTDPYAPKVVRSTMGAIFRSNIILSTDIVQDVKMLKKQGKIIVALDMNGEPLEKLKSGEKYGCIVGSESHGVDTQLLLIADQKIAIAGSGKGESLNAGVAAGIAIHAMFTNI